MRSESAESAPQPKARSVALTRERKPAVRRLLDQAVDQQRIQGAVALRGFDPYVRGASVLDLPLRGNVAGLWQETPSP